MKARIAAQYDALVATTRGWLMSLAPRERTLVLVGAAVTAVLLVWLAVIDPLQQRRAALESGVASQRVLLAWMEDAVAPLEGARMQRAQPGAESLFATVDRSVRATPLAGALRRVQPEGQTTARVWLDDALFDQLVLWVATLEREHGVVVSVFAVERGSGAGLVNARVTLERPQ